MSMPLFVGQGASEPTSSMPGTGWSYWTGIQGARQTFTVLQVEMKSVTVGRGLNRARVAITPKIAMGAKRDYGGGGTRSC